MSERKIDHILIVCCRRPIIESGTGVLSIVDLIEKLTLHHAPPALGKVVGAKIDLVLLTEWRRRDEGKPCRGAARVEWVSPSGGPMDLGPVEYAIDLDSTGTVRSIGTIPLLPVSAEGRYRFRVLLQEEGGTEWVEVAYYPVDIAFRPHQAEEDAKS